MRIKLGTRWEGTWFQRGAVEVLWNWRNLVVGVQVGPSAVYICPLPCVVLRFSRGSKQDPMAALRAEYDKIKDLPLMPYEGDLWTSGSRRAEMEKMEEEETDEPT